MKIVEEAPPVQPKKRLSLSLKWKTVVGVLLIGLIVFSNKGGKIALRPLGFSFKPA